jgi:hypothetical protein
MGERREHAGAEVHTIGLDAPQPRRRSRAGNCGKTKVSYGGPEDAVTWLWTFVDSATTAGEHGPRARRVRLPALRRRCHRRTATSRARRSRRRPSRRRRPAAASWARAIECEAHEYRGRIAALELHARAAPAPATDDVGQERDVEPVMSSPKISPQPENGWLLVMTIEARSDRRETNAELAFAVLLDATVVRAILLPADDGLARRAQLGHAPPTGLGHCQRSPGPPDGSRLGRGVAVRDTTRGADACRSPSLTRSCERGAGTRERLRHAEPLLIGRSPQLLPLRASMVNPILRARADVPRLTQAAIAARAGWRPSRVHATRSAPPFARASERRRAQESDARPDEKQQRPARACSPSLRAVGGCCQRSCHAPAALSDSGACRQQRPRGAGPSDAPKRTRTSTQLAWTRPSTLSVEA